MKPAMKSDTRNFTRKPLRAPARIGLPAGEVLRARTVDISLGGVCVTVAEQLRVGQACMVAFETILNGQSRQVAAKATVIYSILRGTEGFRTGLQFTEIDAANNKTLAELML